MSLDADQLISPPDGRLWIAPVGTNMPTDPTTDPAGFVDLGYVTEDGVKSTYNPTFRARTAWQARRPIGQVLQAIEETLAFSLLQFNKATYALGKGGGSWATSGGVATYTHPDPTFVDYRALILDYEDGDRHYRECFQRGLATASVEVTYSAKDDALIPITFTIMPATPDDAPSIPLTDDPAFL